MTRIYSINFQYFIFLLWFCSWTMNVFGYTLMDKSSKKKIAELMTRNLFKVNSLFAQFFDVEWKIRCFRRFFVEKGNENKCGR